MDLCNIRLSHYVKDGLEAPNYDVKIISNKQINQMSNEEVEEFVARDGCTRPLRRS